MSQRVARARPRGCRALLLFGAVILAALMIASARAKKTQRCQDEEECSMKPEHFKLYSNVKRALEREFSIKGKELVPLIRSVELLHRRFAANRDSLSSRLNGTELVQRLLEDARLKEAMSTFTSDEGRHLINLYKTSINGHHQNLACSQWRAKEIEFATRLLEQNDRLAKVFSNIHKNFLERSARKCLKSSCSSIDDNMNRLDAVLRRPSKRRGFLARDDVLASAQETSASNRLPDESTNAIDEALIAQLENEPAGEFQQEELELCRFLKRAGTSSNSSCQASGNELSEISFAKRATTETNNTQQANLSDYLEAYRLNLKPGEGGESGSNSQIDAKYAGKFILAQCHAIKPTLDYHLYGLRWFQRQGLITSDKLRSRAFWCPSLSYWIEIERLCGELESSLGNRHASNENSNMSTNNNNTNNETFAY